MLIGIEVELNSHAHSQFDICDMEGLSFYDFITIGDTGLEVKMSEEYYNSTIEYNFKPFECTEANFKAVEKYLQGQIDKYGLTKSNHGPAYVGTHIHIFEESKLSMNKNRLLGSVMNFLAENTDDINRNSLERLLFAHQIWGYHSYTNEHKWKNILNINGYSPSYYQSAGDRPKYAPIISSRATSSGKPASLEIRCIPNEFMFNGKAFELMDKIAVKKIYDIPAMKFEDYMQVMGHRYNSSFITIEEHNKRQQARDEEMTIERNTSGRSDDSDSWFIPDRTFQTRMHGNDIVRELSSDDRMPSVEESQNDVEQSLAPLDFNNMTLSSMFSMGNSIDAGTYRNIQLERYDYMGIGDKDVDELSVEEALIALAVCNNRIVVQVILTQIRYNIDNSEISLSARLSVFMKACYAVYVNNRVELNQDTFARLNLLKGEGFFKI